MYRPRLRYAFLLVLAVGPLARADKHRKPTPALPASQYALHETHPAEKVTVAVQPGDVKETEPDTRLDYIHHGFMPMRVIITNDSDETINLDEARILFVAADNTVVQAATDEELQRRLFSKKSTQPTTIPLPAPIPSIKIHHQPVDQKITADDTDFGFITTTVEPHSTASGYLFYDVRSLDEPVLKGASMEIRRMRIAGVNKELYSFNIPLKPTDESPSIGKGRGRERQQGREKTVSLHLRTATPADVPTMMQFVRELAEFEREPDAVLATEADLLRDGWGLAADGVTKLEPAVPPRFGTIMAEWEGEPAGFALYFTSYSTWRGHHGIRLEDLYVTPALRGNGIGKALLVRLAQIAVEQGCPRLEWDVLEWNVNAIAVYERVGARMQTEWRIMRVADEALAALAAQSC